MPAIKKTKWYCDYSTVRLFDSIRRGKNVVIIQALLQDGADINARDSQGYPPLLLACLNNRVKIVDLLIKAGANVDVKYNGDWTVLHYASKRSCWIKIIRTLVNIVQDLDVRDINGETALHHASRSGCLEIMQCLIDEGANIDMKSFEDFTPLLCAAQVSREDSVNLLLNSGANVDSCKEMLLYYATRNRWTKLVYFLVKRVPNLNECVLGTTYLHVASTIAHLDIVKCLLEEGADTNKRNDGGPQIGETALHQASRNGHLELVKCFVENGVDINVKNDDGATPVLLAAQFSNKDVVDLLMKCGANVDAANESKYTLLHFASINGWLDVVRSIVKQNYYLDTKALDGITALSFACASLEFDIVQCLLQAGARCDIEDDFGTSPLNYATRKLNINLIKLLIENGAYLKSVDYEAIVKSSLLKVLLQDEEFCCKAIMNKFRHDLTELYKLPVSRSLPQIEKVAIMSDSKVAQAIKQTVKFEIQKKGLCNILEVRPMVLSMFSVRSVLEYCEKNKSEL